MTGETTVLDKAGRDADRVVLCRCGGAGRVEHRAVNLPGEPARFVRSAFVCSDGSEDVPSEGYSERQITAGEPGFIGEGAAVEGAGHALHMLADAEITDAHLAQRTVEIGEHPVE